jgi:hypothetical protein
MDDNAINEFYDVEIREILSDIEEENILNHEENE